MLSKADLTNYFGEGWFNPVVLVLMGVGAIFVGNWDHDHPWILVDRGSGRLVDVAANLAQSTIAGVLLIACGSVLGLQIAIKWRKNGLMSLDSSEPTKAP